MVSRHISLAWVDFEIHVKNNLGLVGTFLRQSWKRAKMPLWVASLEQTWRVQFFQDFSLVSSQVLTKDGRIMCINIILGYIQLCKTDKRKSWKSHFLWHLFVTHYAKSHLGTILIEYMYDYFTTCICKITGR